MTGDKRLHSVLCCSEYLINYSLGYHALITEKREEFGYCRLCIDNLILESCDPSSSPISLSFADLAVLALLDTHDYNYNVYVYII